MSHNAEIAQARIRNSTKVLLSERGGAKEALVGTSGAIAYALLDLSQAVRESTERTPEDRRIIAIADAMAEMIEEGDLEKMKQIKDVYLSERVGTDIDQQIAKIRQGR